MSDCGTIQEFLLQKVLLDQRYPFRQFYANEASHAALSDQVTRLVMAWGQSNGIGSQGD